MYIEERMELPEDQRDEIELFDAMKKSQNEFNWALSRTGKVCGFMSVIPELVKVPVVVCQDTSPYRQVQGVSAKNNREESVELMHLPPIKLQFQLPKGYPDKCPPTYNLCCNWLNFSQVSFSNSAIINICSSSTMLTSFCSVLDHLRC